MSKEYKGAERAAEVSKAIAHPVRLQIVALLENREMCVNDIVSTTEAKHAITSQQLNILKVKGIRTCLREGAKSYYRIQNPDVIKVLHCINKSNT